LVFCKCSMYSGWRIFICRRCILCSLYILILVVYVFISCNTGICALSVYQMPTCVLSIIRLSHTDQSDLNIKIQLTQTCKQASVYRDWISAASNFSCCFFCSWRLRSTSSTASFNVFIVSLVFFMSFCYKQGAQWILPIQWCQWYQLSIAYTCLVTDKNETYESINQSINLFQTARSIEKLN